MQSIKDYKIQISIISTKETNKSSITNPKNIQAIKQIQNIPKEGS